MCINRSPPFIVVWDFCTPRGNTIHPHSWDLREYARRVSLPCPSSNWGSSNPREPNSRSRCIAGRLKVGKARRWRGSENGVSGMSAGKEMPEYRGGCVGGAERPTRRTYRFGPGPGKIPGEGRRLTWARPGKLYGQRSWRAPVRGGRAKSCTH